MWWEQKSSHEASVSLMFSPHFDVFCDPSLVSITQLVDSCKYCILIWLRYKRTIRNSHLVTKFVPGEQEWRSGESARLPPLSPGFVTRTRGQMWVEFVVDSLPSSEWFFSGYSASPLSSETNISKFQFDLDYCQHFVMSLWLR